MACYSVGNPCSRSVWSASLQQPLQLFEEWEISSLSCWAFGSGEADGWPTTLSDLCNHATRG
ncbi:hypothetical protein DsansV1_C13g0122241 [Dioscorea sansibarensis]